jgi:hypothetical protein
LPAIVFAGHWRRCERSDHHWVEIVASPRVVCGVFGGKFA